jgi:amidase
MACRSACISRGRYGEEATLLALAAELETAQPWFDRVPAL